MIDPDIINSNLNGKSLVSNIQYLEELESTNEYAKINELADGSLVITNYQSAGRGRFQRKWESERGKNLTFSIIKKFDLDHTEQIYLVYFFSYIIFLVMKKYVQNSFRSIELNTVEIKWPNDILVNNKKVAGILIETKAGSKNFVIGVGINVNQLSFLNDNADRTTSLAAETKETIDLNELLLDIIWECERNLNLLSERNFKDIYSLWKNCSKIIGKEVTYISSNGVEKRAIVGDFLPAGNIVLTENGKKLVFSSNEISLQI